jgi:hypothetical protein
LPKWNLGEASDDFYFWGKIVRSYIGKPSEEYIARIEGGRIPDQWHLEIQPLSFQYAEGGNRTASTNMPPEGQAPRLTSALMGRVEAFEKLGFKLDSEDDFGVLNGHIFHFVNQVRQFGRNSKSDDWPLQFDDAYKAPSNVPTVGGNREAAKDPWAAAAELYDGLKPEETNELKLVMTSDVQEVSNSAEIMDAVNAGTLATALVERDLGTLQRGVFRKADLNGA